MRKYGYISLWGALFVLMSGVSEELCGQDLHFSQFTNATQLYNPSYTAQYEQTVKATILHRSQWRTVGKGYRSNGFDGQYKFLNMYTRNYLGAGLFVYQDRAGIADFSTFAVKGSFAYHAVASKSSLLSAGLQLGYLQRSLHADGLAWDAQYDGYAYDPSLDTKERFVNQVKGVVDIAAGINWKYKGPFSIEIGYGVQHTQQEIGVLARSSDKYSLRHSVNSSVSKRMGHSDLRVDALVQKQAGAMENMIGVTFDYRIGDDSRYTNVKTSSLVSGGIFYRLNDAIHPFIGFQFKRTAMFSFGYDIRTPKFTGVRGLPGGPEITISYLGTPGRTRMKVKH